MIILLLILTASCDMYTCNSFIRPYEKISVKLTGKIGKIEGIVHIGDSFRVGEDGKIHKLYGQSGMIKNIGIYENILNYCMRTDDDDGYYFADDVQWKFTIEKTNDNRTTFSVKDTLANGKCDKVHGSFKKIYRDMALNCQDECEGFKIIFDNNKKMIQIHNYQLLKLCLCS